MLMDMQHTQQGIDLSNLLLYIGALILILAIAGYFYASRLKKDNTSRLKKDERAVLKKKKQTILWLSHSLLGVSLILIAVFFIQIGGGSTYNFETLNANVPIDVTSDKDYGGGHTEDPVHYEMKIPTSGKHNPHDLKFGFYPERPPYERLVHNLEHGDIIIYYHPNADAKLVQKIKYFTHFTTAGTGILAMPNADVPSDKEVIATAWTKTLALTTYDEAKLGTFIYQYINKGPEKIPPEIRRGGGTM
jgi:hypothetical protein